MLKKVIRKHWSVKLADCFKSSNVIKDFKRFWKMTFLYLCKIRIRIRVSKILEHNPDRYTDHSVNFLLKTIQSTVHLHSPHLCSLHLAVQSNMQLYTQTHTRYVQVSCLSSIGSIEKKKPWKGTKNMLLCPYPSRRYDTQQQGFNGPRILSDH